jgi:two-component system response regulator YesN
MICLLIVDDERHVVEWLHELFTPPRPQAAGGGGGGNSDSGDGYGGDNGGGDSNGGDGYDFHCLCANNADEALACMDGMDVDIVLTDIRMPGMSGLEMLEVMRGRRPRCRVIFLTGYSSFDDIYRATRFDQVTYLQKTEDDDVIVAAVHKAADSVLEERARDERARKERAQWEHAQGRYAPGERSLGEYAQGKYAPGQHAQAGRAQGEYAQGALRAGEYAQGGYVQGSHAQREYEQGGYAHGERAPARPLPSGGQGAEARGEGERWRGPDGGASVASGGGCGVPGVGGGSPHEGCGAPGVGSGLPYEGYGTPGAGGGLPLVGYGALGASHGTLGVGSGAPGGGHSAAPASLEARVGQFIATHLREDLSLARIGESLWYHPAYLSRMYKQITGTNISAAIADARVEAAAGMLRGTGYSISKIAKECGFSNPQYFATVFHKRLGAAPQEYRKRCAKP